MSPPPPTSSSSSTLSQSPSLHSRTSRTGIPRGIPRGIPAGIPAIGGSTHPPAAPQFGLRNLTTTMTTAMAAALPSSPTPSPTPTPPPPKPAVGATTIGPPLAGPGSLTATDQHSHADSRLVAQQQPSDDGTWSVAAGELDQPQVSFMTTSDGTVVGIESAQWNDFASRGLVHPLLDPHSPFMRTPGIIGRNMLDLCVCPKLAAVLRHMLRVVAAAVPSRLAYHWYADCLETADMVTGARSVMMERRMRTNLTRITMAAGAFAPLPLPPLVSSSTPPPPPSAAMTTLYSWTTSVLSERPIMPLPTLHPPLAVQTPDSFPVCPLCGRLQTLVAFVPPHILHRTDVIVDAQPAYEQDGITPVFGLRGRMGAQITPLASLYAVSNNHQHRRHHPPNAAYSEIPGLGDGPKVWLKAEQVAEAGLLPRGGVAHASVCEVCRLDVLHFLVPMSTSFIPTTKADQASSAGSTSNW